MEVLRFSCGVIRSKIWVITSKKASLFFLNHLQKTFLKTELKCEELVIVALLVSLFSFLGLGFLLYSGLFLGFTYKINDKHAFIYQIISWMYGKVIFTMLHLCVRN